jgi:hypothetical protein
MQHCVERLVTALVAHWRRECFVARGTSPCARMSSSLTEKKRFCHRRGGCNQEENRMATIEQLQEAIRAIIYRAGIANVNAFHLICVSAGNDGIYIMDTHWPEGRRIYQAIGRVVERFPNDICTSCTALLPDMVEAIINAVPLRRSGRGGAMMLLPASYD